MIPILGTDYDSPMMWNVLYKHGAKDRIHCYMVNSFIEYMSRHTSYQSKDAIERLVGLKWSLGGRLFDQEPIFGAMQECSTCILNKRRYHMSNLHQIIEFDAHLFSNKHSRKY